MMFKNVAGAALWLAVACATTAAADKPQATHPPLPEAVSSFGAAVCDGWIYIYGGHRAKTHEYSTAAVLGTFYRVSLDAPKAWEKLPSGPPAQGLALVAHRGKLIRIGGMQPRNAPGIKADNHSLASCERYDPALGKWEPLPDLPEPRSSHDAVVVGDKLYVVGGWTLRGSGQASAWRESALALDLGKSPLVWQAVPQPFQRRALVATAHEGKVYVIGGIDAESKMNLTVNIFDPKTNTWSLGPNLPGTRRNGFSPGSCAWNEDLFVNPADGGVLRLSRKGDVWESVGEIQKRRIVHRMVATRDGRLVVLGGAHDGANIALTESLIPRTRTP